MIFVRTKWKQHFDICKTSSTLLSSFSLFLDSNPHQISFIWFLKTELVHCGCLQKWCSIRRSTVRLGVWETRIIDQPDQPSINRRSTLVQSSLISQGRVHREPGLICRPSVPMQSLRQGESHDRNLTLLNRLYIPSFTFVYLGLTFVWPSSTSPQMYRKSRIGKKTSRSSVRLYQKCSTAPRVL